MCGHRYSSLTLSGVRIGEERRNVLGGRQILARVEFVLVLYFVSREICTRSEFFRGTSTRFTPEFRPLSSCFAGSPSPHNPLCPFSRSHRNPGRVIARPAN